MRLPYPYSDDDERGVVVKVADREVLGRVEDCRLDVGRRAAAGRERDVGEAILAKFLAPGAQRFADAVSEQDEPVAGSERQLLLLVGPVGEDAEHRAALCQAGAHRRPAPESADCGRRWRR